MNYKFKIDHTREKHSFKIENDNEPIKDNINKAETKIYSLINKKFKLCSVFDHKGAKNFLCSKDIALQQIILDDEDQNSERDIEIEANEQKMESKKKKHLHHKKKDLSNEIRKNIQSSTNIIVHKQSFKKINNEKMKSSKNIFKNSNLIHHNFSSNKKNKSRKFFSSYEIKMFKDKELKKIKPIKKGNIKHLEGKKHEENISFLGKNDSSLFDIITELK